MCRLKIPRPDFNLNSLERNPAGHYATRVAGSHEVAHCCSRGASRSRRPRLVRRLREGCSGRTALRRPGAVIINVDGKDYAVNGMAASRYPPIERIWNSATHPEADTGRILSRGLTLCDW